MPVATLPLRLICESVTLTMTFELLSVGSFFRAFSICERSWSVSPWPAIVPLVLPAA